MFVAGFSNGEATPTMVAIDRGMASSIIGYLDRDPLIQLNITMSNILDRSNTETISRYHIPDFLEQEIFMIFDRFIKPFLGYGGILMLLARINDRHELGSFDRSWLYDRSNWDRNCSQEGICRAGS